MSTTLAALRRRANKARDFPANTCPASRHLQDMADSLARYGDYPMFEEDPRHCAESIYAVIAALWATRKLLSEFSAHPAPGPRARKRKPQRRGA